MTAPDWMLVVTLVALLYACRVHYQLAKSREAIDRAERLRVASLDRAMTDDAGACWQCTAPASVLELVDCGDRYGLFCAPCAAVAKALQAPTRQGAA